MKQTNQLEAARWTPKASETDSCPLLVEQKCSKKGLEGGTPGSQPAPMWPKTRISILPS